MAEHQFIRELQSNQYFSGVYAIQNCQLGYTKNNKPFIKCLLGDRTGQTPGRMWNASEQLFEKLPTNGFVFIEGSTQPYQGELQIIVSKMQAVEPRDEDLLLLLPTTKHDIGEMFDELKQRMSTLEHPGVNRLAAAYLADEDLMTLFKRAPAAMSLHHAFIGGLLEHTLQLLRLADVFCPLYPQINRDIVMMGLFLHDLGKCEELTWEQGFGYSTDGQLVGHIARGAILLDRKADEIANAEDGEPVPEPIIRVLTHIILSHHGQPEFGALKIPSTPEAIAVSLLDNVDAKMQMTIAAAREEVGKPADLGGDFTEKMWALNTRLYRPDPTTVEE